VSYNLDDQKDEVKKVVVKKSHYGRGSKPWEPMKGKKKKKKKKTVYLIAIIV